MSDVSISYKGAHLAALDDSGTKTLLTSGKYCEGDIEVAYTKPSGGEDKLEKYLLGQLGDYSSDNVITIPPYAFYRCSGGAEKLRFPNATSIEIQAFYLCGGITSFFAPKAKITGNGSFHGCSALVTAVLGAPNGCAEVFRKYTPMALSTVEFSDGVTTNVNVQSFGNQFFTGCENLKTLVLRSPIVCKLNFTAALDGTPFASGGSGGTIYIPKVLYDHLGDGSALDYKAATNWSTIDGYGTITWAQIEGSQYEHYYADGTPIT